MTEERGGARRDMIHPGAERDLVYGGVMTMPRERWLLLLSWLLLKSLPRHDRDAAELAIALRDFQMARQNRR